jgi:hypothetical protein
MSPSGVVILQQRPLLPVRIGGPGGWSLPLAGILSCGSDITVFRDEDAEDIQVDLSQIPEEHALTDTGLALPCRLALVMVRITDAAGETCEWQTKVGFTNFPLVWPLLGHTGFLEYFTTSLLGESGEAILSRNPKFTGTYTPPRP